MNKLLLLFVKLLPESFLVRFVRNYVDRQIKKHARLNVKGLENLNREFSRPFLFVCNHLSNSDALILNSVLERENIIFVAGKKLEANSLTNLGFRVVRSIPILPDSPDKEAIKSVVRAVKQGDSVLIFPEGTRSRTAQMIEGKKGILLFARLTNAPIVPIGIWGTETFMPINKDMGKEAFYDAAIGVNIGEAFKLPEKTDNETKKHWESNCLNRIMTRIAQLLPEEYKGFYSSEN